MLHDDTIALWQPDAIHPITADGKELAPIKVSLLPRAVSADANDTILGYTRTGTGLDLVTISLGTKISTTVPIGEPVQPPVPLPNGSIVAVGATKLACVKSCQVAWTYDVPEGNAMVTATLDNRIVLRAGSHLKVLAPDGTLLWTGTVPGNEPITSNPLVMSDGRLCAATKGAIHCFGP